MEEAMELVVRAGGNRKRAVGKAIGGRVEREILIGGQPPARDAGADHELPDLVLAALLAFGRAVSVVSLIDPMEFEERVALLVERRRRVPEVAGDMTAQLTALLLDRLGFGNRIDLSHITALSGRGGKTPLFNVVQIVTLPMGCQLGLLYVVIWEIRLLIDPFQACERIEMRGCITSCVLVAVGMRITAHPPRRTGRAQFGHPAPTLGG